MAYRELGVIEIRRGPAAVLPGARSARDRARDGERPEDGRQVCGRGDGAGLGRGDAGPTDAHVAAVAGRRPRPRGWPTRAGPRRVKILVCNVPFFLTSSRIRCATS